MAKFSTWQTSYLIVAIVEISLLIYSQKILRQDAKLQKLISLSAIHHILLSHIKNKTFIISMFSLALCYCTYIQVILVNLGLMLQHKTSTIHISFYIVILLLAATYVVSTILVGKLSHILHKKRMPVIMLTIITIGVMLFSSSIPIIMLIGIYVITFGIGFLGPMFTSLGIISISTGYGTASAMITFSNALTASLFTFVESKLTLTPHSFIRTFDV
ncbi:hypothetical protein fh0823_18560 [Francisella halioticida]|uniref:MFS transporter n=2 Tax=Francisella halioticida TaxID=549298 RepID=A0ABM6M1G0_9GAMM|nr:hypothetical protein CDV26_10505 [Francisella halioticida]BCD91717.1 hypothetical protein fh0823_18560 [Francisella halioticida]